jgi:hypothetical protein
LENHPFDANDVTVSNTPYKNKTGSASSPSSTMFLKAAPWREIYDLMYEKHSSIGLRSGEYGGRNTSLTSLINNLDLRKEIRNG